MDIRQVDIWQPSTARPQPGRGMRFPAALDTQCSEGIKVAITIGGCDSCDQLAIISQLWLLYGIKGKIAAEVSGQIGNQPPMT